MKWTLRAPTQPDGPLTPDDAYMGRETLHAPTAAHVRPEDWPPDAEWPEPQEDGPRGALRFLRRAWKGWAE